MEVRIACKSVQGDYTLSCYPIMSMDDIIGKVIILDEIKRARTLATKMMGAKAKFRFEEIIGQNANFLETVRQAKIASQIKSNVLLLGESGTGKDVFAQAIHNSSGRSDGPYVAINCTTIPRDLITSELFGYSEGAFTGSRKGGSPGKFELADSGTIFLDEVGETPLEMQTALLRVIEDKSIIRIGGTRVTTIDVRIIAATSDPPPAGAGGFLLYYLDIGIKFWNVRKCFSRIFLYTFYEDFSPISRYPDVMIFCFIDSMGTLATSYTLSYQILTRLDSHYITRQESGVLCGSIRI
jgi:ABC-type dipeptide/oligopeptide/nickel transport system ATPase component